MGDGGDATRYIIEVYYYYYYQGDIYRLLKGCPSLVLWDTVNVVLDTTRIMSSKGTRTPGESIMNAISIYIVLVFIWVKMFKGALHKVQNTILIAPQNMSCWEYYVNDIPIKGYTGTL